MIDCRFWGGYLLGIVTVLALNLFDSDSFSVWRIGALSVAALAGLGLLLARRFGGDHGPLASESITASGSPQDPPGAAAGSPVPTESKPPSSFSPISETSARHEDPDSSSQHPPPDSVSGHEPSPPPPTEPTSVPAEPATPGHRDLIDAWHHYWRAGDGHFKAGGLENQLTASGFTAKVIDGADVGAGDHVLIVDPQSPDKQFYVLPSFVTSPRSVQKWFHDQSGGALTGTTRQVNRVALGRWIDSGAFEVVKKGAVS